MTTITARTLAAGWPRGGAAAIYLVMSLPISYLTRRLEARFARGQSLV